jgi:tetratricopeptide (TPR) repeat protein
MNTYKDISRAVRYHQTGQLEQAEIICRKILASHPDQPDALHLLGVIAHQTGNHRVSLSLITKAIQKNPENPQYFCSIGDVLNDNNQITDAISSYRKALHLKPDMAEAHYNIGNSYHRLSRYEEAIRCYQKALELKPDLVEAYYNLANTFMDQGDLDAAVSHYQRALVLEPAFANAHFNLGIAYFEHGQWDQALAAYQKALTFKPDWAEIYYNMGLAHYMQKKLDRAVACYQKAIELKPVFPEAHNNLGSVLQDQKKHGAAIACFLKVLDLKPDDADALYNMGKSFHELGRYSEAIACYQKALRINPGHHKACNNIAKTYQDQCKIQKAALWFKKALQIKPDYVEARFNLATVHLLTENFKEGWKGYEWRFRRREWKRTYPHRYRQPRWTGENFAGKRLLVHSEQGLGDILQFVRYLPKVKARGGTVVFETRKALMDLFKNLPGMDDMVMFAPDRQPSTEFDLYVPLASLPRIFETTLENIPAEVPYLFADQEKIVRWQERLSENGLRVGLVWAGTDTDPRRACHLKWLKTLSDIPGVYLYGLQKGIAAEQIEVEGLPQGMRMTNLGQEFEDFTDTAAVVENLDLIVSIDTSVAHLAGAMGKPVWLMLPYAADWRWFLNRDDSPWYPTMRLFRQPGFGDWQSVGRHITAELKNFVKEY